MTIYSKTVEAYFKYMVAKHLLVFLLHVYFRQETT